MLYKSPIIAGVFGIIPVVPKLRFKIGLPELSCHIQVNNIPAIYQCRMPCTSELLLFSFSHATPQVHLLRIALAQPQR